MNEARIGRQSDGIPKSKLEAAATGMAKYLVRNDAAILALNLARLG
jgi:hypothetical protein